MRTCFCLYDEGYQIDGENYVGKEGADDIQLVFDAHEVVSNFHNGRRLV